MALPGACLISPVSCVGITISKSVLDAILATVVGWVGAASAWVWAQLGAALNQASASAVVTTAATSEYRTLLAVAPLVAACALVANVLGALRRSDGGAIVRDLVVAVPVLVLGAVAAIPLATLVLNVANGLSDLASANASAAVAKISGELAVIPAGTPGVAALALDFAAVAGAILLWFELVVRNAVLALLLCLSPVLFAAAIWSPLRRVAVRLVETFAALALAKFVVVVALALGLSAAASGAPSVVVTGIATVLLATLTPYLLLRAVPFLEASAVHALDGVRQRAVAGATRSARTAASGLDAVMPMPTPTPPERPEDLGLEWWPSGSWPEMPEMPDEPPVPPVGKPTLRTGHVAWGRDEMGPVLGWHWDD